MTSKKVAAKYDVHVRKIGWGERAKWVAFRGGNGTGMPVVDIAEACSLRTLSKRISAALRAE